MSMIGIVNRKTKTFFEQAPDVEVLFEFNGPRKTPVRNGVTDQSI